MNKITMLKGVIEVYENDFCCGYEGEDKEDMNKVILNLIVHLAKYANDIRYCSKKECPCSPEYGIKNIMDKHSNDLDRLLFRPYGLTDVNMPKVRKELSNIMGSKISGVEVQE